MLCPLEHNEPLNESCAISTSSSVQHGIVCYRQKYSRSLEILLSCEEKEGALKQMFAHKHGSQSHSSQDII